LSWERTNEVQQKRLQEGMIRAFGLRSWPVLRSAESCRGLFSRNERLVGCIPNLQSRQVGQKGIQGRFVDGDGVSLRLNRWFSNSNPSGSMEQKKKRLSFSEMVSRHGPVFIVYYGSLWVATGVGIYFAIKAFGPETAFEVSRKISLDRLIDLDNMHPSTGNIALAVALNEAFEIVRFPFVIATTPAITSVVERVTGRSMQRDPPKFATMIKTHGLFFMGYWASAWVLGGFACYAGITLAGPESAFDALRVVGLDQFIPLDDVDPEYGNIAMAIIINEALEPIRLPLVVATTPMLKKALFRV